MQGVVHEIERVLLPPGGAALRCRCAIRKCGSSPGTDRSYRHFTRSWSWVWDPHASRAAANATTTSLCW
eukprot:SM000060S19672  [mRNA]  locus=s60:472311:472888:+ [translate_table: standard]